MDVCVFNISEGILEDGGLLAEERSLDPFEMLDSIIEMNQQKMVCTRKVYILEHFDMLLEHSDPLLLSKIRYLTDYSTHKYTVILMGRPFKPLPDILSDIPCVQAPLMSTRDIQEILDVCEEGIPAHVEAELLEVLKGLTELECENLLSVCLSIKSNLDCDFLRGERTKILQQRGGGLIQLVDPQGDLHHVGGLGRLKEWLKKRGRFMRGEKGAYGLVPAPKGVLLTGPPGCGKSFTASCLAGSWNVNLIKLGPARLFSSLVGGTEKNVKTALETVKSLAPCVLWIDEFEKFFPDDSGSASDGGVLLRVMGLFLDFLQKERAGVFVCATTNRIAGLPNEILRSGRFDAVFFIDLPNRLERGAILKSLFKKYGIASESIVNDMILDATEGFSGAEMEQTVIEALYETDGVIKKVSEFLLVKKIGEIIPLSRTMEEQFDVLRQWCLKRVRAASFLEADMSKERRNTCHISPR